LPGNQLQEEAKKNRLEGTVYENVNLALDNALKKAAHDDLIIICGSIFLVAEVELDPKEKEKS
jgi:dihydrofolate synthase/folylpolyglutamate synthase